MLGLPKPSSYTRVMNNGLVLTHSRHEMLKEPLNNPAWSAFQSEKPQIVWCDTSDSSRSHDECSRKDTVARAQNNPEAP